MLEKHYRPGNQKQHKIQYPHLAHITHVVELSVTVSTTSDIRHIIVVDALTRSLYRRLPLDLTLWA